jgi:hypothetical protein
MFPPFVKRRHNGVRSGMVMETEGQVKYRPAMEPIAAVYDVLHRVGRAVADLSAACPSGDDSLTVWT